MVRNIQLNHGGKYVCLVDTDVESLSADAILVVKGRNKLSSVYISTYTIFAVCANCFIYTVHTTIFTVKSFLRGVYFNVRALLM